MEMEIWELLRVAVWINSAAVLDSPRKHVASSRHCLSFLLTLTQPEIQPSAFYTHPSKQILFLILIIFQAQTNLNLEARCALRFSVLRIHRKIVNLLA